MSTTAERRSSTTYIAVALVQTLILPLISGTIAPVMAAGVRHGCTGRDRLDLRPMMRHNGFAHSAQHGW